MLTTLALRTLFAQQIVIPRPPAPPTPDRDIVVEAGKFERQSNVVRVDLSEKDAKKKLVLRDPKGRVVPFQIDERGHAAFLVEHMKPGEQIVYRLVDEKKLPPAAKSHVTIDTKKPDVIRVLVDGKPAVEFQGQAKAPRPDVPANLVRAGFINPVYTPSGVAVTEAYPVDDPRDLGIWSFWPELKVQGHALDFWKEPRKEGVIQMESMGPSWSGAVDGGFEARQIYTGIKIFGGRTLLHETWRVTVYPSGSGHPPYFLFDIESQQTASTPDAVEIPKAPSGGIAVRGRKDWAKAKPGIVRLTSEGHEDPVRARWAYVGGQDHGKMAGIAVLSHPSNIGAPQNLSHVGWPEQPVVNFAGTGEDALTVARDKPLSLRYRFVAIDGKPDPALLERLWNDFATPPTITVRLSEKQADKSAAAAKH